MPIDKADSQILDALNKIAHHLGAIVGGMDEIRIELKKKRWDDAAREGDRGK